MFSKFERLAAWRYLRAKRKEGFISVITGFAFTGIALGVATLIIVMSVMNGFKAELLNRILGINGHIEIVASAGFPFNNYKNAVGRRNDRFRFREIPTVTTFPRNDKLYGRTRRLIRIIIIKPKRTPVTPCHWGRDAAARSSVKTVLA